MLFNFQNINYTLGGNPARQINLTGSLAAGNVLVVRGASGAGKSTLLRALAKLQPCHGEAFLLGQSWHHIPPPVWRIKVHYLAQQPALFDGSVADNLAKPFTTNLGSKHKFDPDRAKALMQELLLDEKLWLQDAQTLSGGEAARVAFIRSLLIEPRVLLLDEPTAALDEAARSAFYKLLSRWLREPNRAVLLVSHINDYHILPNVSFIDISPA
ncbi:ABC transporter ATP-binding protein [Desulforamulus hydrothermalis]|uniref:Putative transporter subunit: ATP-binding component of ABC superfamily n=1 Tax=Desulforamulus hydrothermalis Lam5 = DSM 18033 TaxID=1121428 RepID=K8EHR9_9FIRM|nr:ATP-binding cassette domain-containing protein [Desulforamulus hydrothermalis]CCO08181.1 putative transporter subunit: ATP-binding component of ABC superfamily [Desulforamulus hydrothermalis Lam5 = DSM 18033]SHH23029.1 putative ABC transport system ATP-binding protein [Desulforamulus hydrothermalis Lam5 = DSM 18033]